MFWKRKTASPAHRAEGAPELEAQLAEARRRAARRAQWGERAESPDVPEDVVEQFRRAWTHVPPAPSRPEPASLDETAEDEWEKVGRRTDGRIYLWGNDWDANRW